MRKKAINLLILGLLSISSVLAKSDKIVNLNSSKTEMKVISSKQSSLLIENSISAIKLSEMVLKDGQFVRINVPKYTKSSGIGLPELPVFNKLIEVPHNAEVIVRIVSFDEEVVNLNNYFTNKILPAQPSISKNVDSESVIFQYDRDFYLKNEYSTTDMAKVSVLGTMRSVRFGRITISPFSYNPVENILIVRNNIKVEIEFINADFEKTDRLKKKHFSPVFDGVFKKFLHYNSFKGKDLITTYPIKYVIVSDPMFEAVLQPFIDWKTKKGFTVIEAYTDDPLVGNTTTSIKSYLAGLYNNATISDPAPTYLLIVGDVAQVPTFNGTAGSHVTDLYYCEYDGGGDFYPEIYYGRFSATNNEQLIPQIDKTLEYEQYQMPDPSYLNEVVMIAGVDAGMAPTYGNGQINYGTDNYFNLAHGLTSHTYLYPASASSAAQIIQDVSNGVGYANYTAHCGPSGWSDPSFSTSDVPGLQNAHEYPLMVGNCCSSVEFQQNECFGEAVLRAANKGAVGYIGGSNSTYWDEDFWWGVGAGTVSANPTYAQTGLGAYDRTFHDNGELEVDWYITQGQMVSAGNLAVTAAGGSEHYYWEIYHLMGDPSVMIYFSVPPQLNLTCLSAVPMGTNTLTVTTEPNAYIAISNNGILLDAKLADANGLATLQFNPLNYIGSALIVGTKQNRAPYIDSISVISLNAAFVIYTSSVIDDSQENNNQQADFGENIFLDVTLSNLGTIDGQNITATLNTNDSNLTIINATAIWGTIAGSANVEINGAFEIKINDFIEDMHNVVFTIDVTDDNSNLWTSYLNIDLHAPKLAINSFSIDDSQGNSNGRLDPGEQVTISLETENIGSIISDIAIAEITSSSPDITISNPIENIGQLDLLQTSTEFSIIVGTTATIGTSASFTYNVNAGDYSVAYDFSLPIGLIVEDWETNDFSTFQWNNSGANPWSIDTTESYEGNSSSQSGSINDNESSLLTIEIDVVSDDSISFYRKVSCEEGGLWYGTYQYYDYLEFGIDGNSLGKWDGEKDWEREAFPITAGTHTLQWLYKKDGYYSDGEDKAWIDFVVLPLFNGINFSPVFVSSPIITAYVDSLYSYDIISYDSNTDDTLNLNCIIQPSWLVFTDNGDGTASLSGTPIIADLGDNPVKIELSDNIANSVYQEFSLNVIDVSSSPETENFNQNIEVYPNPFIAKTIVNYSLEKESNISIKLCNSVGQEISTLLSDSQKSSGDYQLIISGKEMDAGIYYCKISIDNEVSYKKIVKIK